MIDSGQQQIRPVPFASDRHPGATVEAIQRGDLIERLGPRFFDRPDRPYFDTIMLIRNGGGTHTIDFETITLTPGQLVRTRPGQVQSWDLEADVEATIVLSADMPAVWSPATAASCQLDQESLLTTTAIVDAICREQDSSASPGHVQQHLFMALAAIFDRQQETPTVTQVPDAYGGFCQLIEEQLGASLTVAHYAAQLGYSERTISRACQQVTGLTAKGVLDQRIVLEAKRLLANTDQTGQTIATQLGFSEPSNFTKFFRRHTGERPGSFRSSHNERRV